METTTLDGLFGSDWPGTKFVQDKEGQKIQIVHLAALCAGLGINFELSLKRWKIDPSLRKSIKFRRGSAYASTARVPFLLATVPAEDVEPWQRSQLEQFQAHHARDLARDRAMAVEPSAIGTMIPQIFGVGNKKNGLGS